VLVDYEEDVDFSKYQTFTVESREARAANQAVSLSPIVDRRIERSITEALQAKGYEPVEAGADLRVIFHTVTHTRTEVNDWRVGASPFRRHPYYGYSSYSFIDIYEYEEGTFIIDLVDTETDQLVWRGASNKRLGWTAPSQEEVDAIVERIFLEYPPEPDTVP